MKKKGIKLLCLVLTLVIAIGLLAGCGGDDEKPGGNKGQKGSEGMRNDIVIATANEPPTMAPISTAPLPADI